MLGATACCRWWLPTTAAPTRTAPDARLLAVAASAIVAPQTRTAAWTANQLLGVCIRGMIRPVERRKNLPPVRFFVTTSCGSPPPAGQPSLTHMLAVLHAVTTAPRYTVCCMTLIKYCVAAWPVQLPSRLCFRARPTPSPSATPGLGPDGQPLPSSAPSESMTPSPSPSLTTNYVPTTHSATASPVPLFGQRPAFGPAQVRHCHRHTKRI